MIGHPRIFFYLPQETALRHLLLPYLNEGPRDWVGIVHSDRIRGLEDEIFVEVVDHPYQLPRDVEQVLQSQGFTRWRLDDSANRCRHQASLRRAGYTR